ncbi:hypothetical protein RIF29_00441 [Crotalaria pallida]|uniref:Uncharacterized protein n=1 Tax=Crotalaria pallida TaxID=3830 RepID=A0AAN9IVR6_CROPI
MEDQNISESSGKVKRPKTTRDNEANAQEWKARWEGQNNVIIGIFREKEKLNSKIDELSQEKESMKNHIEALQNDLALSHHHADHWWSTAKRCQNSLNVAMQRVEQLKMKVEYIEGKLWEYSRDIEEQEMWLANWELEAEDLKADRDAWRKKYQQLSNNLILYGTTWLGRYEDSFHELRENIHFKMLPKLDQFYKCCKRMARGLKSCRDINYLEN